MTDNEHDGELGALTLLADVLPEVAPGAPARARLLEAIGGPHRFAPLAPEIASVFDVPLAAVLSALARVDDASAWRGSAAHGPALLPLHGRTVISRLPAGTRIPKHGHKVRELTYVLDGELISNGVPHGRASCMDMAPGTEHALQVSDTSDCMVVFAEQLAADAR